MKAIHIFYADDDEDDLMFFNEAIEKISADSELQIILHIHKNGEKLIDNIRNYKDENGVVFLDINMPFKTGFELLEEIRNHSEIGHFPAVMYSTSSNIDFIDKSKQLGANYYVVKPFEFNHLLKMLTGLIAVNWKKPNSGPDGFLYTYK